MKRARHEDSTTYLPAARAGNELDNNVSVAELQGWRGRRHDERATAGTPLGPPMPSLAPNVRGIEKNM